MTADLGPERYGHLDCNSPIAPFRADRLVVELAADGHGQLGFAYVTFGRPVA